MNTLLRSCVIVAAAWLLACPAILLAFFLAGCSSPGGVMRDNGTITPCPDWHTDNDACGRAIFNAPRLAKIRAGMSMHDVRATMQHDPERKEIVGATETWIYMSDYEAEQMTAISFIDGKVSAMTSLPWKKD